LIGIFRNLLITGKTILGRGSRSDRPHYSVTTPIRAGHWSFTLTFQSIANYGHDPHTKAHKLKFKGQ